MNDYEFKDIERSITPAENTVLKILLGSIVVGISILITGITIGLSILVKRSG